MGAIPYPFPSITTNAKSNVKGRQMNYNIFLFSNLLKLFDKNYNEMPYDLQYSIAITEYEKFFCSEFNTIAAGEYECISAYLNNKYPIHI